MRITLDTEQLDAVAPFAIVCNGDLVIERIGPSLSKAMGGDLIGAGLLEAFTITRPQGIDGAAEIRRRAGSAFLLQGRRREIALRCQPICSPDHGRILFLGSPALVNESDMTRLGLGYDHFAVSDPTPDLLILKRTQERSLSDLAALNGELQRSAARLRSANRALREAERRYRVLVEQQPLVTYIDELTEVFTCLFVSENVAELTGYPVDRWTSEPNFFFEVLYPDDYAHIHEAHVASVRDGTAFTAEYRLVRADGEVIWVRDENKLVYDDDDEPLYRFGYMLDITERRTTENELRDTGTRLQTLIGSLQDGVLVENEDRRVALTNEAFCSVFGIPAAPAELIGADCDEAAQQAKHLAADPEGFVSRINEIHQRRVGVHGEEIEFADGRVFERDYVPVAVAGEYRGNLWGYRDVTPRIEAQRAIEAAHDQAVAASRAKSEFLATVSHEIRTPMHGVLGTIDLLERTALDDEQTELASIVKSSAAALLSVINDMLDLRKAESGHIELVSEPVDIGALITGVADMLGVQANTKGLTLFTEVDEQIREEVLGDPDRLRQILVNLAGNAVNFTHTGAVTIRAQVAAADERTATVALVVSDTGVGIPPEAQEEIFEPFAQADSSSTRRHEGTGLGLTITKKLVELMGGSLTLTSVPDQGTVATALIPMKRGARRARRPEPGRQAAPELAGTVLVVEDSQVNRDIALRQLSRLGVRARAVDSGAAAVDALERRQYDLALMDVRMPEMSGLEATRAIRARELVTARPRAVIVALTANARPSDREACLDAGMDDFATKPLMLDELERLLVQWLGDQREETPRDGPGAVTSLPQDENVHITQTLDALADAMDSRDDVSRVMDVWLVELPERLTALRAATAKATADSESLCTAAHTLKSTFRLVGAASAGEMAAELEQRAIDKVPVTPAEIEAFAATADRTAAAVRAWRDGAQTAGRGAAVAQP